MPGHIETGRVPGIIWVQKWSTGKYRHRNDVQAHMGAGRVCRQMFPVTYEHRNGARAHFGTGRVPRHVWVVEWCPGTYGHWKGARAHVDTGKNARAKLDIVKSTR